MAALTSDEMDAIFERNRDEVVDPEMARVLRQKTPTERLQIAFGMIDSARAMLRSVLRQKHPDWSDEEVQREVARRISHCRV